MPTHPPATYINIIKVAHCSTVAVTQLPLLFIADISNYHQLVLKVFHNTFLTITSLDNYWEEFGEPPPGVVYGHAVVMYTLYDCCWHTACVKFGHNYGIRSGSKIYIVHIYIHGNSRYIALMDCKKE